MLDPGSTVREGEFANAQNAAGVPARIASLWNNLQDGTRLTEEQRADFIAQARAAYNAQAGIYNNLVGRYHGLATGYDIDPNNIALMAELEGLQTAAGTNGAVDTNAMSDEELLNYYSGLEGPQGGQRDFEAEYGLR